MVTVNVDFKACKSSAMCCIEVDDVFSMDDKGYLHVASDIDESRREAVELAAELCPNRAITVEP
ncbi:MAG: ferredoxin [Actinobacteria bacterium]|nr:ferredoxin [Actinomycetota bacterium]